APRDRGSLSPWVYRGSWSRSSRSCAGAGLSERCGAASLWTSPTFRSPPSLNHIRDQDRFRSGMRVQVMTLQQNTDHIQTTHVGRLPRPHALLDLLKAKYAGQPYEESELDAVLKRSVAECVSKQVDSGIEIVTDGEFSKPGFFTYIRERFDGFEQRPSQKLI